ncbi:MAG: hypothetical protein K6V97_03430 [Actinomycetia bacterium]|nr:hypothetical protein [Actinomycetes bacterium]
MDALNRLIPPLQGLVEASRLSVSAGAALASLPAAEQEALWAALGEAVGGLRREDIAAAKREAADEAALRARVAELEAALADARGAADKADDRRVAELEAELERLRCRPPRVVERLVERADPAQAARIAELERQLQTARAEAEAAQARLAAHEAERAQWGEAADAEAERLRARQSQVREAERRLAMAREALAAAAQDDRRDDVRARRAAVARLVRLVNERLRPALNEWQALAEAEAAQADPLTLNAPIHFDVQQTVAKLEALAHWLRGLPLEAGRQRSPRRVPIAEIAVEGWVVPDDDNHATEEGSPDADAEADCDEGGASRPDGADWRPALDDGGPGGS